MPSLSSFVTPPFTLEDSLSPYVPVSISSFLSLRTCQSFQIGYALAIAGISSILLQIILLPTLLVKVDHARLYNICMFFWPLTYLAVPLLNIVARRGVHERVLGFNLDLHSSWNVPGVDTMPLGYNRYGGMGNDDGEAEQARLTQSATYMIWLGIFLIMIMSRIGCLAYSCVSIRRHLNITKQNALFYRVSMILVIQNAPSPSALGKANGIVLWAMCFSRAFAPAFIRYLHDFIYLLSNVKSITTALYSPCRPPKASLAGTSGSSSWFSWLSVDV